MALYLPSLSSLSAWETLHTYLFDPEQEPATKKDLTGDLLQKALPRPLLVSNHHFGDFFTIATIISWALSFFPRFLHGFSYCLPLFITTPLGSFYPCVVILTPIFTISFIKLKTAILQQVIYCFLICLKENRPLQLRALAIGPRDIGICFTVDTEKAAKADPCLSNFSFAPWFEATSHFLLSPTILLLCISIHVVYNCHQAHTPMKMLMYLTCNLAHLLIQRKTKYTIASSTIKTLGAWKKPPLVAIMTGHLLSAAITAVEYALFVHYPVLITLTPLTTLYIKAWFTLEIIAQIVAASVSAIHLARKSMTQQEAGTVENALK